MSSYKRRQPDRRPLSRHKLSRMTSRHISPFFGFTGRLHFEVVDNGWGRRRREAVGALMVLGSYFFDRENPNLQWRQVSMGLDILEGLLNSGAYTTHVSGPEGAATERQLLKAREALMAAKLNSRRY